MDFFDVKSRVKSSGIRSSKMDLNNYIRLCTELYDGKKQFSKRYSILNSLVFVVSVVAITSKLLILNKIYALTKVII